MRRALVLFVGITFLCAIAVLRAEEDSEKAEKVEKPKKAEKAEKAESSEDTEASESTKPEQSVPSKATAKAALVLPATQKGKYYFEGNTRKMHVSPAPKERVFESPQTGAATTSIPGVTDAQRTSVATPGSSYHRKRDTVGDAQTRTLPVSGGMRRMEPGVMLPAQSFTVTSGIGIVPYTPLSDAGLRAVTSPKTPYYGRNKGKYEFGK